MFEGIAHVFTHLTNVATGCFFLVGLENGEQIVGCGRITIDNFLHGGVPGNGDTCGTGYLGGVGEPMAFDVALLDVGHVGEADATAIDAEEEEVASKG